MKFSYNLTLADYKAALLLHRRQKLIRRLNAFIWPVLTVVLLICAIVFSATDHSELFSQCLIFGAMSLWFTIFLPIARYFNMRKGFKRIFLSGQKDQQVSIDIDNERILSEIPGVGEGKYFWNTIIKFAQDEKMTLFYVYKDRFLLFPTAVLTPAESTELSELVARNMVRKEK